MAYAVDATLCLSAHVLWYATTGGDFTKINKIIRDRRRFHV
jgi:hypothetical protein